MKDTTDHQRPKAYHHGDLRNALIETGLALLSEGGARELDLRKVARKAGVSHAAPYRHFADKQALIAAINEVGFNRLAEQIQSTLREAPEDALAQLQGVAIAYVQFSDENPWLMREMFSGLTIEREAFPALYEASKNVYRLYIAVVKRGQESGAIREGDPAALAGVLWSVLHGVAMLIIENQIRPYAEGPEGIDNVTRFAIQMLYDGLGRI
ncbi:MAG TPA: TetR/AcrR family transcriptional regulator [Ktedonobacteraceae bacterium]|nr:TetR/AcrR family transcriptional regulator [Ktedonobacteraceae bacterium]